MLSFKRGPISRIPIINGTKRRVPEFVPSVDEVFRTAESRHMPEQEPQNTDGTGDRVDRLSDIDQQISDNLRKLYQSTVEEDLPQSLRDLLDRLAAQDEGHD